MSGDVPALVPASGMPARMPARHAETVRHVAFDPDISESIVNSSPEHPLALMLFTERFCHPEAGRRKSVVEIVERGTCRVFLRRCRGWIESAGCAASHHATGQQSPGRLPARRRPAFLSRNSPRTFATPRRHAAWLLPDGESRSSAEFGDSSRTGEFGGSLGTAPEL